MEAMELMVGVWFITISFCLIIAGVIVSLVLRRRGRRNKEEISDRPRTDEEQDDLLQRELFE
ncbi:hypothetical protein EPA93_17260 [Ktedonosporobacter rubrisoli]|uniref:Uncharacterized protein n=1 Tax=Ktedonosporobacter rubrisoli TaxID=2509675 RepID=A0A4P6JQG1_KTERU|nr:hypothetical protein [Ktedonosporobacter rubrisoli]QBD77649.1 hypothetical protein EPA93_17260 [Ktedonosporobacter rubrisoli]